MFKKRKKIIVSTNNNHYMELCKRMNQNGIEIKKVSFDPSVERCDIHTIVTKEEAYWLLDLTTEYDAVLWKGEG